MKTRLTNFALGVVLGVSIATAADEPLPSWNDGPAKQSILAFVEKVTKEGSPDFVPVPERIAVFDNDGTLWAEQPILHAAPVPHGSNQGPRTGAPRMEDEGTLRLAAQRRPAWRHRDG